MKQIIIACVISISAFWSGIGILYTGQLMGWIGVLAVDGIRK